MHFLVVTDPINKVYGAQHPEMVMKMGKAGIPVLFTDLDLLRDSNLMYAAPVRTYGRLFSRIPYIHSWMSKSRFTNPLNPNGESINGFQLARLLFFKANHRKLLIADGAAGICRMIVTSMNPADSSSAHSNMGIMLDGPLGLYALDAELDFAAVNLESAGTSSLPHAAAVNKSIDYMREYISSHRIPCVTERDQAYAQWLSEGAIKTRIQAMLNGAAPGDQVRIAMFYLSDRDVIRAIKNAAYAGANVRLILDPNKDAFGRVKNGIPNRPVAAELMDYAERVEDRLDVRWAATHGEQFHTKAVSISHPQEQKYEFLCGSANWTRRNLDDLNMEANLYIFGDASLNRVFDTYFDRLWSNSDGLENTLPYTAYGERGFIRWSKSLLYRIQESTGMSTF
jgi:phosphatidylserine/phosphatidylglycerophosphate/cardiolipin synthase-like enzyme